MNGTSSCWLRRKSSALLIFLMIILLSFLSLARDSYSRELTVPISYATSVLTHTGLVQGYLLRYSRLGEGVSKDPLRLILQLLTVSGSDFYRPQLYNTALAE